MPEQRVRVLQKAFIDTLKDSQLLAEAEKAKLAVNALIFAINNSVSEALVLAERAGIDRATAYEVFTSSAAVNPALTIAATALRAAEQPELSGG